MTKRGPEEMVEEWGWVGNISKVIHPIPLVTIVLVMKNVKPQARLLRTLIATQDKDAVVEEAQGHEVRIIQR